MNLFTKKTSRKVTFFFFSCGILISYILSRSFIFSSPSPGTVILRVPPAPTELLLRGFIIMHPRRHFWSRGVLRNPSPSKTLHLEDIFRVLFEAHVGRKQGHPYPVHHHSTVDFKLPLGKWRCMSFPPPNNELHDLVLLAETGCWFMQLPGRASSW